MMSALFANMIVQQTNLILMLLGATPHPESGEKLHDTEAARMFIDQLEMLEVKTKGNLTKEEAGLLKQSLMTARLAFVEAVEAAGKTAVPAGQTAAAADHVQDAAPDQQPSSPPSSPAAEEESRKKFTKKY